MASSSGGAPRSCSQLPGWTICKASYSAASRRSSSETRALIESFVALPRFPNSPGGLILAAATEGDIPRLRKLAKRLKEAGKSVEEEVAAVNVPIMRRRGPLHIAAWLRRLDMCKFLIKDLQLDVNAVDADANDWVDEEHGGQLVVVELVVAADLQECIDAADGIRQQLACLLILFFFGFGEARGHHSQLPSKTETCVAPLHFAIQGPGCTAIVSLLLDRGADPNKAGRNGLTPLHIATKQDIYEIAELLLSRGAYVDPVCEKGAPLHIAAKDGNARMMALLLQHHANPNRVVQLFYTPLIVAIFASSLNCVDLLIKAGADVNAGKPVTPLIAAANDGLADCIKCLLEAGADANIPDEIGRMPIEIAAIQGWKECVDILFPFTSPLARFADWSIDGRFEHAQFGTSKTHDHVRHENNGSFAEVQGDAAFKEKDYAHAAALYTTAMDTETDDSTFYAKRSLCQLHLGERNKAVYDAYTYKEMEPDFSKSCYEQGAALILLKEYDQACKALISGLKLDFGSSLTNEASR